MTKARLERGRRGEAAAEAFLAAKGLRLLDRGWRCALGELDLVMRDAETVVFVEVKSRASARFGRPEEAVDGRKQARLARLAQAYLLQRRLGEAPVRFDVVAVLGAELVHIPDAFRP